VALVGLLGIFAGEQIIPVAKQIVAGDSLAAAWRQAKCALHIFGMLTRRHADETKATMNVAEKAS
jgi:xanthosine utilization system XapX-like protein